MIRQPLILTEKDASYRLLLEQHLASLELDIHPFLEIGNTEFIVRLLLDNQGVSFLPEFTVRQDIENGRLVRFTSRALPCASGNRSSITRISG